MRTWTMRHRCRSERNTKTLGRHLAALASRDEDEEDVYVDADLKTTGGAN